MRITEHNVVLSAQGLVAVSNIVTKFTGVPSRYCPSVCEGSFLEKNIAEKPDVISDAKYTHNELAEKLPFLRNSHAQAETDVCIESSQS